MKKMESVLKDINQYFGFLYEKGFKIQSANYYPDFNGNWVVILESPECLIRFVSDRGEISIDLSPAGPERENRIGIRAMIYYLTQGRKFVDSYQGNTFWGYKKQMENLAELIKEHIDQAIPYFGDNFYLYRDKLKFSQREYNNKYMEYHLKKTK